MAEQHDEDNTGRTGTAMPIAGGEENDSGAHKRAEADPETPAAEAQAEPDSIDSADPDALKEQVARLQEALLRARAEMDNLEKRSEREQAKSRRFALEGLIRDLLPVLDSLDRGLEAGEEADADKIMEGMALTHKLLAKALARHGLVVLEPEGDRFDPNWHEAISTRPTAEEDPDTVLEVVQKGFRLHERLLRPARVVVARPDDDNE